MGHKENSPKIYTFVEPFLSAKALSLLEVSRFDELKAPSQSRGLSKPSNAAKAAVILCVCANFQTAPGRNGLISFNDTNNKQAHEGRGILTWWNIPLVGSVELMEAPTPLLEMPSVAPAQPMQGHH
jgi:hypothetical protein